MTDTRESELTAESRLVSDLIAAGLMVAKPYFEKSGGDLLGFVAADPRGYICRIQSKYRDCSKRTQVNIPAQYIEKAFLLYLHLMVGGKLYQAFLLPSDIQKRFATVKVRGKDMYRLNLTPQVAAELGADPELELTPKKVKSIKSLMRASSALADMHKDSMKLFAQANEIIALSKKIQQLSTLIYRAKIAKLQKEAAEEHLATTQQLLVLIESQLTLEQKKELGMED